MSRLDVIRERLARGAYVEGDGCDVRYLLVRLDDARGALRAIESELAALARPDIEVALRLAAAALERLHTEVRS